MEKFPNAKILDFAVHLDETTPHVHMRKVWLAQDEYGDLYINQNQAFKEMEIERPHPEKPQGRYNNPKMVYSEICREKFIEIAKEKGIGIETEPLEPSKKSKELLQWQIEQDKKHIEELEQTIEKTRAQNEELRENIAENEKALKSQNTALKGYSDKVEKLQETIEEQEKCISGYKKIKEKLVQKDIFGKEKDYIKLDLDTASALYQAGRRQETFDEEVKKKDKHYEQLEFKANNVLEQLEKKKKILKNREDDFDSIVEIQAKNLNKDFEEICKIYGYHNVCRMIETMKEEKNQEKNRDYYFR